MKVLDFALPRGNPVQHFPGVGSLLLANFRGVHDDRICYCMTRTLVAYLETDPVIITEKR